jgi:chromate reductase
MPATTTMTPTAAAHADGTPVRILGVSGSMRRDAWNTKLLRAAASLLPTGAELTLYGSLKSLPPFDEDDEPAPHGTVHALRDAVRGADALLIATPEYNHSIPGQLKNAVDWLSRPKADAALLGLPTTVIGASTGLFGAVWAQAELRKVLTAAGASVLDEELPVGQAPEQFDAEGSLASPELRALLAVQLGSLVDAAAERRVRRI